MLRANMSLFRRPSAAKKKIWNRWCTAGSIRHRCDGHLDEVRTENRFNLRINRA